MWVKHWARAVRWCSKSCLQFIRGVLNIYIFLLISNSSKKAAIVNQHLRSLYSNNLHSWQSTSYIYPFSFLLAIFPLALHKLNNCIAHRIFIEINNKRIATCDSLGLSRVSLWLWGFPRLILALNSNYKAMLHATHTHMHKCIVITCDT